MSTAGGELPATIIESDGQAGLFVPPGQRMSAPENLDWHMILDHELSQLSAAETGVLGSLGFTGLGGALGFLPSVVQVIGKLPSTVEAPVTVPDMVTVGVFVACAVLAAICLVIYFLNWNRNKGLADTIRKRPKFKVPESASP